MVQQDRLALLREKRKAQKAAANGMHEIQMEVIDEKKCDDGMSVFEGIKQRIDNVREAISEIEKLKQKIAWETKADVYQAANRELDEVMSKATKDRNWVKKELEEVKKSILDEKQKYGDSHSTSIAMKQNFLNTYTREFVEVMKQYNLSSKEFQDSIRDRIGRQARIVDPTISEEVVGQICENPGLFQNLISGVTIKVIAEIEERHERIQKIERDMRDILQLFQDLALLVSAQQENIDAIQKNVDNAVTYVAAGADSLAKAEAHQKQARKCKCYLIIILVVILAAILLGVLGSKIL